MALREMLKEATRDEHVALEALLALDRPALTLEAYQDYLRVTHAFYGRVEPALRASRELAALGLDMGLRAKRGWLEADLAWFGVAPLAVVGVRVPAEGRALEHVGAAEGPGAIRDVGHAHPLDREGRHAEPSEVRIEPAALGAQAHVEPQGRELA